MPWLPRRIFHDWPKDATDLNPQDVRRLYESGFAGCKYSPEAWERFRTQVPEPDGEEVVYRYGLEGTGAGKLIVPFVFALELFPGCWPGAAQGRGDCVSHDTKNAALLTMACDIVAGVPDEETGQVEGVPEVPEEGIREGVLSSEALYWYRGYDGDGWFCPEAAQIACTKSGLWLRQDYAELGFDLTRYSASLAGKYGRTPPPEAVTTVGRKHLAHRATNASTAEAVRDLLANGYGVSTCGGEGIEDTRDEWGVSRRQGSWAHAMAWIGFDDRDAVKQKYGGPLGLDLNSWGKWNKGPRDIYDSAALVPPGKKDLWVQRGIVNPATGNILIPEGSCWVRWSEMSRREFIALSGVNGFPAKNLPLDYLI